MCFIIFYLIVFNISAIGKNIDATIPHITTAIKANITGSKNAINTSILVSN
jgi:hypothetical protein